jgi:hypothetical protein
VAAHPDDEILGVGGTLAQHAEAGGEVIVLIMSEGEAEKLSHTPNCKTRKESALAAGEIIGAKEIIFHDYPDQRMDSVPLIELIKPIESALERFSPEVVYTHHFGDANTDHQVIYKTLGLPPDDGWAHVKSYIYERFPRTSSSSELALFTQRLVVLVHLENKVKALVYLRTYRRSSSGV